MSRRLAWLAGALALLAAGIVVLRPSDAGRGVGVDRPAHASTALPVAKPMAPRSRAETPPTSRPAPNADGEQPLPRELEDLVTALYELDGVRASAAAAALIERGDTRAIASLARVELRAAAGGGASVVHALGRLGAVAGDDERATAVDRLLEMMAEEKRRGAPESAGNLLQIYEALGDIADPRAAGPLEAELADATVGRAPKVVIVQALGHIGQHSSRAPLLRLRDRETEAGETDSFQEELRRELVAAIEVVLPAL